MKDLQFTGRFEYVFKLDFLSPDKTYLKCITVLLDCGWGPPPLSIVKFEVRTCFLHFTNSCQHPNLLETGQSSVLDTDIYYFTA